jgi:hypothetical protein
VKKTIGRFQLEAPTAYQCKQILGLCQKPSHQKMHMSCGDLLSTTPAAKHLVVMNDRHPKYENSPMPVGPRMWPSSIKSLYCDFSCCN